MPTTIAAELVVLSVCLFALRPSLAADKPLATADAIRVEAIRANDSDVGRPLPLAAHWNTGEGGADGFTFAYQMRMIEQGHYLMPWLGQPPTDRWLETTWKPEQSAARDKWVEAKLRELEGQLKQAARMTLPIGILGTQWEHTLTDDKRYFDLPPEKNPNVIGLDGKPQAKVSPLGPVGSWREVGKEWTSSLIMKKVQEFYPEPPLVLFISNNEHSKLQWTEVETSKRYLDKYGKGRDYDFRRKLVADAWIERYRALQDGLRDGLSSPAWKKNSKFIGYEAFGPCHLGRPMTGPEHWKQYSLYSPGRIDPSPLMWDGGSPSYYTHDWMSITDYEVWSPQVESMNWVFMLDEARKLNPLFWFEIATWDGNQPGSPTDKRKFYAKLGQTFSPDRYGGMVKFGLWLLRPRAAREFRGWLETVEQAGPYFMPIVEAVDRVHNNAVLREFWRKGELVPNRAFSHPYQVDIPDEFSRVDRWFLLDTSLDAPRPWTQRTEIAVFALALVKGNPPDRQWLVYAHAPLGARPNTQVTVPEFGPITIDVSQAGSFHLVAEKDKKVAPIFKGGPASVRLGAQSQVIEAGKPVNFVAHDAYSPDGALSEFRWDFGDGHTGKGAEVTHTYRTRGQFMVELKAADAARKEVRRAQPVFVGLPRGDGLVLRYLMTQPPADGLCEWIWRGTWFKPCYHFVHDSSGNSNLGFATGDKWVVDESRGPALELSGADSFVTVLNSGDLNTGGPYRDRTVLVWFKAIDAGKRQVLFEEGGPGNGLNLRLENGALHGGAWASGLWPGTWLSFDKIAPGKWHRAALVLRGAGPSVGPDNLELYVDGRKAGSGRAAWLPAHTADINFGRSGSSNYPSGPDDNAACFAGRLGNCEIYNRALSETELRNDAAGDKL